MGGAITALADGADTLYYNPAGLAFGPGHQIQVTSSLYGITGTTLNGALGGGSADLRSMNLQVVPANISFEVKGLNLGRLHLSKRWGLGLSILAPYSFKFGAASEDRGLGKLYIRNLQESTYSVYLGVAYRIRDRLSFGLAIVAVFRQVDDAYDFSRDFGPVHVAASGEQNTMTLGHSLAFGVRYRPREHLWLGVGLHLPLQHLASFASTARNRFTVLKETAPGMFTGTTMSNSRDLDVRFTLPLRLNLGLAWEVSHRWALSAGITMWMPHEYNSIMDRATHTVLAVNRHAFTINAQAGAEVWLRRGTLPLRMGVFTSRSPIDHPTVDSGLGDKFDLYGGTVSIGFRRAFAESELGVLVAGGPVTGLGFDLVGGTFKESPLDGTRWEAMISYSTRLHY